MIVALAWMVLEPGVLDSIVALAMPELIETVFEVPPPTNVAAPEVTENWTEPLEASCQPEPSST